MGSELEHLVFMSSWVIEVTLNCGIVAAHVFMFDASLLDVSAISLQQKSASLFISRNLDFLAVHFWKPYVFMVP
jgi:hypothetical protein